MTDLFDSFRDDAFGIALSSPSLLSPQLDGPQGWSPCSSAYTDGEDDEADEHRSMYEYMPKKRAAKRQREAMASLLQHKRRTTMAWPMPPTRIPITQPLSFSGKARRHASVSQSLEPGSLSSGSSSSEESSAVTMPDGFGAVNEHNTRMSPRKSMQKSIARRFFSVPAPSLNFDMDKDEKDNKQIEQLDEAIPLMPLLYSNADWDDEEAVKMARLQASMSLLGVQETTPRVGHYALSSCSSATSSASSHTCSPNVQSESASPTSSPPAAIEQTPTAGLCLLRMALSPEHKAPTLQEQMAFASGLGSMCSWASPMNQSYLTSANDYVYTIPETPMGFASTLDDALTETQSERQQASRHIRQNVAAASMAAATAACAHHVLPEETYSGSSRLGGSSLRAQDMSKDEEEDQSYCRGVTPTGQDANRHSLAASTMTSLTSSPIMHGALSASSFDSAVSSAASSTSSSSKDVDPITPPSMSPWQSADSIGDSVASMSTSPALEHNEYSYLTYDDSFLAVAAPQDFAPKLAYADPRIQVCEGADGFNGNTFSPCLATPDLGLTRTPSPMQSAPSPYMQQESIRPSFDSFSSMLEHKEEEEGALLPVQTMSHSRSLASVLQRPRPIASSQSASFFGFDETESSIHRIHVRKRAVRSASAASIVRDEEVNEDGERQLPSACVPEAASQFVVPARKASLDMLTHDDSDVRPRVGRMRQSISFKDEPHPRHLLDVVLASSPTTATTRKTSSALPSSQSTGSLGPKGLAQVREACRLKTLYLRDGKTLIGYSGKVLHDERPPPVPLIPATASKAAGVAPIKKTRKAAPTVSAAASQKDSEYGERPSQPVTTQSTENNVGLPTLFIARTPSQRKRGATGVPATEPRNLAMAKMGMPTTMTTRTSSAYALASLVAASETSAQQEAQLRSSGRRKVSGSGNVSRKPSNALQSSASCSQIDPALAVAAEVQSSVADMPQGFILVVEQQQVVESSIYHPA